MVDSIYSQENQTCQKLLNGEEELLESLFSIKELPNPRAKIKITGKNERYLVYVWWENKSTKRQYVHRFIMEQFLKRKLSIREIVHHINGDTKDNRIENLELISSQIDHMKTHYPLGRQKKKKNKSYTHTCIRCGIEFSGFKTQKFCGKTCAALNGREIARYIRNNIGFKHPEKLPKEEIEKRLTLIREYGNVIAAKMLGMSRGGLSCWLHKRNKRLAKLGLD